MSIGSTPKYACPRCRHTHLNIRGLNAVIECLTCKYGFYLEEAIELAIIYPRISKRKGDWVDPRLPELRRYNSFDHC